MKVYGRHQMFYELIIAINQHFNSKGFKHNTEVSFKRMTESLDEKRHKLGSISNDDIADLAKYVVINQVFDDGNHRTAVALCYHISLIFNHQLLKIKPYLLYAAVDFEYYKSMYHHHIEPENVFYQGNAILIAIYSRAIKTISSDNNDYKEQLLVLINDKIGNIPSLLTQLSRQPEEESAQGAKGSKQGRTTQQKLFLEFAGHRPSMAHSTSTSPYDAHLRKKGLLTTPYLQDICRSIDSQDNSLGATDTTCEDEVSNILGNFEGISINVTDQSHIDSTLTMSDVTISPGFNGAFTSFAGGRSSFFSPLPNFYEGRAPSLRATPINDQTAEVESLCESESTDCTHGIYK